MSTRRNSSEQHDRAEECLSDILTIAEMAVMIGDNGIGPVPLHWIGCLGRVVRSLAREADASRADIPS